jgi:hypothetical protein
MRSSSTTDSGASTNSVDPLIAGHPGPLQRLVEADGGGRRCGPSRGGACAGRRRAQLGQPVPSRHHLLAGHVTAALGPDRSSRNIPGTRLLPQLDGAPTLSGAVPVSASTTTVVSGLAAHPGGDRGHLALRQVADVGQAESVPRRSSPTEHGREPGLRGRRTLNVPHPRHDTDSPAARRRRRSSPDTILSLPVIDSLPCAAPRSGPPPRPRHGGPPGCRLPAR